MPSTWSQKDLNRSKLKKKDKNPKKDAADGKNSTKPKRSEAASKAPKRNNSSAILKKINCRSIDKRKKRKRIQYTQSDVHKAIDAYNNGISLRRASRMFGVPVATLSRRKLNPEFKRPAGPATILTSDEEEKIVEWIFHRAKTGAPVTKTELLNCVQTYVLTTRKETPFKDCRPGRHWYEAFRKRHPAISTRVAQDLITARANVCQEDLLEWFGIVGKYLEVCKLKNIPPHRCFNCDETYMPFCPKAAKVLAEEGMPNVHRVVDQNEREGLTVLFTYSADGTQAPPMVLYPLKDNIPQEITSNFDPEYGIGYTENRWQTAPSFYEYVTNVFYPWLLKHGIERPVQFFLDGHSSHATKPLVDFCKEHEIELILLPPHATHVIQPLDKSYFGPLKKFWANELPKWKVGHKVTRLTRVNFPLALKDILKKFNAKGMVQNGFKACGLHPWNPQAVDYNVFDKREKKDSAAQVSHGSSVSEQDKIVDVPALQILRAFEGTLDEDLLHQFKQAEIVGEWTGDDTQKGSFQHWIKMKNSTLEKNPQECQTVNGYIKSSSSASYVNEQLEPVGQVLDISQVSEQNGKEIVSAENSSQNHDTSDVDQGPIIIMNESDDGIVSFELMEDETLESLTLTNQPSVFVELPTPQNSRNQVFDVHALTSKEPQIDTIEQDIRSEKNCGSTQRQSQWSPSKKGKATKKSQSHSPLSEHGTNESCESVKIDANVPNHGEKSAFSNNLNQSHSTVQTSGVSVGNYETPLVSNENVERKASPTKSKPVETSAREKENNGSISEKNDEIVDIKPFQEIFQYPE